MDRSQEIIRTSWIGIIANVLLSWTIIIQNNPVSLCSRLIAAFRQSVQQCLTALQHVAPSGLEVARVPRVGHVTRPFGEVHQHHDLPFWVATADVSHVADVPRVHAYQQVVAVIV